MNRPIKFRAWNKPTQQMHYVGFFTDIFDKGIADRRNFEAEHNEFMQFTGLLDKNGKKIYEGDIISDRSGIFPVYFEYGVFRTDAKDMNAYSPELTEIIGNVWENPELLKV